MKHCAWFGPLANQRLQEEGAGREQLPTLAEVAFEIPVSSMEECRFRSQNIKQPQEVICLSPNPHNNLASAAIPLEKFDDTYKQFRFTRTRKKLQRKSTWDLN
ncbi:hypothetical protein ILYODFUR_038956 [Ilyodon furcidens]|uniref:Uncharacterized protein n=1 Tax=Ilyodon furcidens TaxID=33524 RepID=A0ABV0TES1_9TELE